MGAASPSAARTAASASSISVRGAPDAGRPPRGSGARTGVQLRRPHAGDHGRRRPGAGLGSARGERARDADRPHRPITASRPVPTGARSTRVGWTGGSSSGIMAGDSRLARPFQAPGRSGSPTYPPPLAVSPSGRTSPRGGRTAACACTTRTRCDSSATSRATTMGRSVAVEFSPDGDRRHDGRGRQGRVARRVGGRRCGRRCPPRFECPEPWHTVDRTNLGEGQTHDSQSYS